MEAPGGSPPRLPTAARRGVVGTIGPSGAHVVEEQGEVALLRQARIRQPANDAGEVNCRGGEEGDQDLELDLGLGKRGM